MMTYNIGTGLVIARREDGSWSPPSAISSFGVGWGAQVIDIIVKTNYFDKTIGDQTNWKWELKICIPSMPKQ